MPTEKLRMSVTLEGFDSTSRAFREYGKDAQGAIRDAATRAVTSVTPFLIAAMESDSRQTRLVATTIRPIRDRTPVIAAGGGRRVAPAGGRKRKRPSAGDVFFGAEFGGGARPTTRQFRPHRGSEGYAFYPAFRRHFHTIIDAYYDELDKLSRDWER